MSNEFCGSLLFIYHQSIEYKIASGLIAKAWTIEKDQRGAQPSLAELLSQSVHDFDMEEPPRPAKQSTEPIPSSLGLSHPQTVNSQLLGDPAIGNAERDVEESLQGSKGERKANFETKHVFMHKVIIII